MSLERYSGGPNPFTVANQLLDKLGKNKADAALKNRHEEVLKNHIEYANAVHQNALEAHAAQVESRIKEISTYHKMAEPGTPFQVQTGETSVSMVKKTPKARTPKTPAAPAKTAKPLPVRDPKTGRAMKAPQ